MQVHYLNPRPAVDHSGVAVEFSTDVQPESVSVLFFAPGFAIPPGRASYNVSDFCCLDGFLPLQPLAFRVHAHELGRRIWLDAAPEPVRSGLEWERQAVRTMLQLRAMLQLQWTCCSHRSSPVCTVSLLTACVVAPDCRLFMPCLCIQPHRCLRAREHLAQSIRSTENFVPISLSRNHVCRSIWRHATRSSRSFSSPCQKTHQLCCQVSGYTRRASSIRRRGTA